VCSSDLLKQPPYESEIFKKGLEIERIKKEMEEQEIIPEPQIQEKPKEKIEKKEVLKIKGLPKKHSLLYKIIIRVGIILLFIALIVLILFFYWLWKEKPIPFSEKLPPQVKTFIEEKIKKGEQSFLEEQTKTGEQSSPEEQTKTEEQIFLEETTLEIPDSLFPIEEKQILEFLSKEEIPKHMADSLGTEWESNSFVRILLKDKEKNKIISLKDFLEAFQIKNIESFYQKVEENFTLFIFINEKKEPRIGFAVKTKDEEGLKIFLKNWEKTMEADFDSFFALMGKKEKAISLAFKESSYKNLSFRYQDFTNENLGLCYLVSKDFFILTGSGETLFKTIDKIKD
jgi:hypothetical protein